MIDLSNEQAYGKIRQAVDAPHVQKARIGMRVSQLTSDHTEQRNQQIQDVDPNVRKEALQNLEENLSPHVVAKGVLDKANEKRRQQGWKTVDDLK